MPRFARVHAIRETAQRSRAFFGEDERMQDRIAFGVPLARDRRAALPPRIARGPVTRCDAQRTRRGALTAPRAAWRRTELGTNHIACFGVWRRGTRRQAERRNRAGTTRWQMPHRGAA
jgi:hypothetical protein